MEYDFYTIGLALLVAIGLFFALRELFCWYWKVNVLVKNTQKQNELLERLIEILERR